MRMRTCGGVFAIILFCVSASLRYVASSSPPICSQQSRPSFLTAIFSQCPLSDSRNSTLEINGDFLERILASKRDNGFTSVLLYAVTCPFSSDARVKFEILSSMYPVIEHYSVEHSSAMPSLFSMYGVHSLPALIMINQTSKVQFHGSRNLDSLIKFYKKTTGYDPIYYMGADQLGNAMTSGKFIMESWIGSSVHEMLEREPYLMLSVLFLCLRVLAYVYPRVINHLRGIWISHGPHLNVAIFGETSLMLGRICHVINLKRIWLKSRNFHQSARSAQVWASSLASVPLGETSTSRPQRL